MYSSGKNMDEDKTINVYLVIDTKVLNITFATGWTAEDLCIKVEIFNLCI